LYKNWVYTEEIFNTYRDKSGRSYHFNGIVEQATLQLSAVEINENQTPDSKVHEIPNLQEAQKKIRELEKRVKDLEKRIPQKYPDVKYLNYRSRKRILVSVTMY
jgi:Tfp pilus assembly protein PilO